MRVLFTLALSLFINSCYAAVFNSPLSERVEALEKSVASMQDAGLNRHGTGFVVLTPSRKPVLITNAHVCVTYKNLAEIRAVFSTAVYTPSRLINFDYYADLCALEVGPELLNRAVKKAPYSTTGPSQPITILGFPADHDMLAAEGIAGGLETAEYAEALAPGENCYGITVPYGKQLVCLTVHKVRYSTAVIMPGSSGSPVFDSDNRLVGIANSMETSTHRAYFIDIGVLEAFLKGH